MKSKPDNAWLLRLQQEKGLIINDPIIDKKTKDVFGIPNIKPKRVYSNIEKNHIEWVLIGLQIPFAKEYKFFPTRKFRMDWAIIENKIGIEYEGIFSPKSGHTTVFGYSNNCSKYNLATINGWRMLRYTSYNYKNVGPDLEELLFKELTK